MYNFRELRYLQGKMQNGDSEKSNYDKFKCFILRFLEDIWIENKFE